MALILSEFLFKKLSKTTSIWSLAAKGNEKLSIECPPNGQKSCFWPKFPVWPQKKTRSPSFWFFSLFFPKNLIKTTFKTAFKTWAHLKFRKLLNFHYRPNWSKFVFLTKIPGLTPKKTLIVFVLVLRLIFSWKFNQNYVQNCFQNLTTFKAQKIIFFSFRAELV